MMDFFGNYLLLFLQTIKLVSHTDGRKMLYCWSADSKIFSVLSRIQALVEGSSLKHD